jgi:hypothetical protein
MPLVQLLRCQWAAYSRNHQSRANLLLHAAAVPLFLAGNVLLVVAMAQARWLVAAISLAAMILSAALQGFGHCQEAKPSEPFTGPLNAALRMVLEQWDTFPRFVLSGRWWRAFRSATD